MIQFIDFLLERGELRLVYRAGIGGTSRLQKEENDYDTKAEAIVPGNRMAADVRFQKLFPSTRLETISISVDTIRIRVALANS